MKDTLEIMSLNEIKLPKIYHIWEQKMCFFLIFKMGVPRYKNWTYNCTIYYGITKKEILYKASKLNIKTFGNSIQLQHETVCQPLFGCKWGGRILQATMEIKAPI